MATSGGPGSGQRALVTGATGFIGSHLVRALAADGWRVDTLDRTTRVPPAAGVTSHPMPDGFDDLARLIATLAPEVCFHLATAFRGVHTAADITPMVAANIELGVLLAEAISRVGGCRFVNTGTVWQHYDAQAYSPVSLYAATKQAFTDVLQYYQEVQGVDVVTLELTDTYGPDDPRTKLLPVLVRATRTNTPVELTDGSQLIDLLHVSDAVRALIATARGATGATYGASGGDTVTLRQLVDRFEAATGLTVDARWGARASRPREMLRPWMISPPPPGWSPEVSLEQGLRELLAQET